MKPKFLIILVVAISLLAIAAFVVGITGTSFEIDTGTLVKKWSRQTGGGLSQGNMVCGEECRARCHWQGQTMKIPMKSNANCSVSIAPSADVLRRGILRARKGEILVSRLVYRTENKPLKMGEFTLSSQCGQSNDCKGKKRRWERELQFSKQGGSFLLTCKSSGGCLAAIPELAEP